MLRQNVNFTPVRATRSGKIQCRQTSSRLTAKDRIGGLRVRWDIGRNDYAVAAGLYACGKPDRNSPVLVTSNYKLTFDSLRKELDRIDAWILALDTHGVNVWCAAGKGTFGTEELIRRVGDANLASLIDHRDLVLPQLGASGVAGWKVTEATGFRVRFGPVYAKDLREYLEGGMKKTDRMREVRFALSDRLAVAPVEISHSLKFAPALFALAVLFSLPAGGTFAPRFLYNALSLVGGLIAGTVLFPALLPLLPFRAFSAKGSILGLAWGSGAFLVAVKAGLTGQALRPLSALPAFFVTVPLVAFLAMNFTGSSTFTCQKGAELEVKYAVPPMLASLGGGIGLALVNLALSLSALAA